MPNFLLPAVLVSGVGRPKADQAENQRYCTVEKNVIIGTILLTVTVRNSSNSSKHNFFHYQTSSHT